MILRGKVQKVIEIQTYTASVADVQNQPNESKFVQQKIRKRYERDIIKEGEMFGLDDMLFYYSQRIGKVKTSNEGFPIKYTYLADPEQEHSTVILAIHLIDFIKASPEMLLDRKLKE